ncbi:MAG: response regulator receiver protein [Chitinophagaceae bacterium]|jgi:CheY-like chemotaxis protein|nr:response regulator receiver protein [Chitinophagaceae bacterium]
MNHSAPIIIIDDDQEDHLIISDGIASIAPAQVLYFRRNGVECLSFLEELAATNTEISLLVFDLNMPKMGGVELLRRVKADERFNRIPIIIYSTSINLIEKENCMKLGAHAYFTKPLSFSESIEIAGEFLAIAAGAPGAL